jgi:hypothetical protein
MGNSTSNLNYQRSITLLHRKNETVAGSIEDEAAIAGRTMIYGMIYSSANVVLDIDQGVNDSGGIKQYRYNQSFPIVAGVAKAIEVPVVGTFARARVTGNADVEIYIAVRGFE